jgi:hypothetical protein
VRYPDVRGAPGHETGDEEPLALGRSLQVVVRGERVDGHVNEVPVQEDRKQSAPKSGEKQSHGDTLRVGG